LKLNNDRYANTTQQLVTCQDCKNVVEERYKDEHVCFAVRFNKKKKS